MKNALALAVVVVLFAAPAFAGDGHVSQGTLSALGLGGMQPVSDAEAMQVRGLSASSWSGGAFVASGALFDTDTGNHVVTSGAFVWRDTAENAGLNVTAQTRRREVFVVGNTLGGSSWFVGGGLSLYRGGGR